MGDRAAAVLFAAGESYSDFAAIYLGGDRYSVVGIYHEISEFNGFARDELYSDFAGRSFVVGFLQPRDAWDRDVVF